MLTIPGNDRNSFCDGMSRRNFLQIGGLAMGGLTIPQLLRAESESTTQQRHKSVIMIFLLGGPPHQDTFDLKTEAPAEIRGPFQPIKTNVRGVEVCELLPGIAKSMDKLIAIRSVVGSLGFHTAFQCMTGRRHDDQPPGGWPYIGSVLSKLEGPVHPDMPVAIGLEKKEQHFPFNRGRQPGFLGPAYAPFQSNDEQTKTDMVLKGMTLERLQDRQALLRSFDQFRREVDASGNMEGLDAFHQQAFEILTSSRMAEAFDLDQEDPKLRERYGAGSPLYHGGPLRHLDQFVLARRLVEAGARCVTLSYGSWDWHTNNFGQARKQLPLLDQGVTALVQDLHDRGLDEDVTVLLWGEFGRTPTINKDGGRDHWPNVSCALLAGGGMRSGQVIGSTDKFAGEAKDRPVHFQEVYATLYHNLGIDAHTVTVPDLTGRPRHLVDSQYKPLPEVI